MSLAKQQIVDLIEIAENGTVQVRTKTVVTENGEVISTTFHRHSVIPGTCGKDEDPRVQAVCATVHTQSVIDSYRASIVPEDIK